MALSCVPSTLPGERRFQDWPVEEDARRGGWARPGASLVMVGNIALASWTCAQVFTLVSEPLGLRGTSGGLGSELPALPQSSADFQTKSPEITAPGLGTQHPHSGVTGLQAEQRADKGDNIVEAGKTLCCVSGKRLGGPQRPHSKGPGNVGEQDMTRPALPRSGSSCYQCPS